MSLRSRIRGGQAFLTDRVATAAQFLTLRLGPLGSTHMGCDDSDGPGHAPRYLCVSRNFMKYALIVIIGTVLAVIAYLLFASMGTGSSSRMSKYESLLRDKSNSELLEMNSGFSILVFDDGELRSISDDSHSSPWGGNMIIADGTTVIWSKMGHSCGWGYLNGMHRRYLEEMKKVGKPNSKKRFIGWMNTHG